MNVSGACTIPKASVVWSMQTRVDSNAMSGLREKVVHDVWVREPELKLNTWAMAKSLSKWMSNTLKVVAASINL